MKRYGIDALELVMKSKSDEPAEFTRGGQVVMTYSPIEGLHEISAMTFKQPMVAALIETIVDGDEAVAPVSRRHLANMTATMQILATWDKAREV